MHESRLLWAYFRLSRLAGSPRQTLMFIKLFYRVGNQLVCLFLSDRSSLTTGLACQHRIDVCWRKGVFGSISEQFFNARWLILPVLWCLLWLQVIRLPDIWIASPTWTHSPHSCFRRTFAVKLFQTNLNIPIVMMMCVYFENAFWLLLTSSLFIRCAHASSLFDDSTVIHLKWRI